MPIRVVFPLADANSKHLREFLIKLGIDEDCLRTMEIVVDSSHFKLSYQNAVKNRRRGKRRFTKTSLSIPISPKTQKFNLSKVIDFVNQKKNAQQKKEREEKERAEISQRVRSVIRVRGAFAMTYPDNSVIVQFSGLTELQATTLASFANMVLDELCVK